MSKTIQDGEFAALDNLLGALGQLLSAMADYENEYGDTDERVKNAAMMVVARVEEAQLLDWWPKP